MELYEAILSRLFNDFKNRLDYEYNDNEKRRIIRQFQIVYDSCRRRFVGRRDDLYDSLEDLIDLSSSVQLEYQIEELLKLLGINSIVIDWDNNYPTIDKHYQ